MFLLVFCGFVFVLVLSFTGVNCIRNGVFHGLFGLLVFVFDFPEGEKVIKLLSEQFQIFHVQHIRVKVRVHV